MNLEKKKNMKDDSLEKPKRVRKKNDHKKENLGKKSKGKWVFSLIVITVPLDSKQFLHEHLLD